MMMSRCSRAARSAIGLPTVPVFTGVTDATDGRSMNFTGRVQYSSFAGHPVNGQPSTAVYGLDVNFTPCSNKFRSVTRHIVAQKCGHTGRHVHHNIPSEQSAQLMFGCGNSRKPELPWFN
jgi:hypothetical protein